MTPDQFPTLRISARSSARFDEAVRQVADGLEAGAIRNVVLNDAKQTLSSAVYAAWETVRAPHFYGGRYEEQPRDVNDLDSSMLVSGLHEVLAANRKLAKTKAAGAAVEAMKAFVKEALPLAQAVASLKDKVVKGRAPNVGTSAPVNPNKLVQTCPCCFRAIAVLEGTVVHHGYSRPGDGWQTASCAAARRFKPLEVSNKGLAWLIATIKAQLLTSEGAYSTRESKTTLLDTRRVSGERKLIEITRSDEQWRRVYDEFVWGLEQQIASCKRDLELLEPMLRDWQPAARQEAAA